MTKNKPIYHAWNVNRWKDLVKPRPFVDLQILNVINQFIFGDGVVIYFVYFAVWIWSWVLDYAGGKIQSRTLRFVWCNKFASIFLRAYACTENCLKR